MVRRHGRAMRAIVGCLIALGCQCALAQAGRGATAVDTVAEKKAAESPWLLLPTFSVSPKLGTSLGAMAGYLHYFDEKSPVSMLVASLQYTSTDSIVAGLFGKAAFGGDQHRVTAGILGGNIKNDYDDFLGTGQPLKSEDQLRAIFGRYLYRVAGDWFGGAQAININYATYGLNPIDEQALNALGLVGFKSVGAGLVAYHDSRDLEASPSRGWMLNLNNVAYREGLGSQQDYDVYRGDFRAFWSHGEGHVLALRQNNQLTHDAPASASSSVSLRGYKQGQYLGKNMSSLELEERYRFAEKWTATLFGGFACLYGDGRSCSDRENLYPSGGFGVQYALKRREGIVLNLEYGAGKDGSYGVYLKMGYAY